MAKARILHALKTHPKEPGKTPKTKAVVLMETISSQSESMPGAIVEIWDGPDLYDRILSKGLKFGDTVELVPTLDDRGKPTSRLNV